MIILTINPKLINLIIMIHIQNFIQIFQKQDLSIVYFFNKVNYMSLMMILILILNNQMAKSIIY